MQRLGRDPQSRQHPAVGAVLQRDPQRSRPHLDGADRLLDLVEHHRQRLPLVGRFALNVDELGAVCHRIEGDDKVLRQLHRQHRLFARRQLDRIDGEFGKTFAERFRQIDARAPENLAVIFDFRERIRAVGGDATNAGADRKGDLDHLVERRLIAGGAQPAIVFVAIDILECRAGIEHAAAAGAEHVPRQFENSEPRGMQERGDGALFVELVCGRKSQRIDPAQFAIRRLAYGLFDRRGAGGIRRFSQYTKKGFSLAHQSFPSVKGRRQHVIMVLGRCKVRRRDAISVRDHFDLSVLRRPQPPES
jgi:hypothetical protein